MPDAGFSVDLVYDGNDLSAESSADCEFSNFLFFFGIFGIKKLLPNFELPLAEGWAQIKNVKVSLGTDTDIDPLSNRKRYTFTMSRGDGFCLFEVHCDNNTIV